MDVPERPGSGQLRRSSSGLRGMYRRNSTMSKYVVSCPWRSRIADWLNSASFVSEVEMAQDEVVLPTAGSIS